ncbi:nitrogenase component 1 [Desulfovibrio sp. JY]|nr:nitrogenase component 1 [Desulfovibrio sp. JY]
MRATQASIEMARLTRREDFPFAPLEGVGPNLAGWGVIETSLLLPESLSIMAGPSACLRHSAFMAHARGFGDRFYMLCLEEVDMTMGRHLEKIEKAVRDIAATRPEKAIFLIVGCPDYILGTDFTGVLERLTAATGRRVILGAMAPITIGLKESPFTSAYTSFYEFLKDAPRHPDPDAVNLLGTFMPLSPDGEFYDVLRAAGVSRLTQIPLCADLAEFSRMASAGHSLVLHPLANGMAGRMEKELGIPSLFVPTAYGFGAIAAQYAKIGEALGRDLDTTAAEKAAREAAGPLLDALRGKTIAIGGAINGSPYELALAFVDAGLTVDTIFGRGTFKPYEWKLIERLREVAPHIRVYNVSHPNLCGETAAFDHVDVAYGVDAGMFCAKAVNVPLSRYQEQHYGYENAVWMLEETRQAMAHPVSNHDWIYRRQFLI